MNKVILRFYIVSIKKTIEVIFDTRLSFLDNIRLLNNIYSLNRNEDIYIVDPFRMMALKKDVPINEFNFKNFMTLYIY